MCGLCGFLSYAANFVPDLHTLTNALMDASESRGQNASGIAFLDHGRVATYKLSKPASRVNFRPPAKIHAFIGHTRHTTHGSERQNYNNHPFHGRAGKTEFALAHNGVLFDVERTRREHKLPTPKIETDSYLAVQLLEQQGDLSLKSLKRMAETVQGSYSFSILDNSGSVHLVKGDSPLSLLHFPSRQLYVYASTDQILWSALIETDLFQDLQQGKFAQIPIQEGEILTIAKSGQLLRSAFDYIEQPPSYLCDWRQYGWYNQTGDSYLADLHSVAASMGFDPDFIDKMRAEGFSYDEIEEILYNCEEV